MGSSEWNKNKLTVADVIYHYCEQLEADHGIKVPVSKRRALFMEALLRNVVSNELRDMMLFITDEDKWSAEMDRQR